MTQEVDGNACAWPGFVLVARGLAAGGSSGRVPYRLPLRPRRTRAISKPPPVRLTGSGGLGDSPHGLPRGCESAGGPPQDPPDGEEFPGDLERGEPHHAFEEREPGQPVQRVPEPSVPVVVPVVRQGQQDEPEHQVPLVVPTLVVPGPPPRSGMFAMFTLPQPPLPPLSRTAPPVTKVLFVVPPPANVRGGRPGSRRASWKSGDPSAASAVLSVPSFVAESRCSCSASVSQVIVSMITARSSRRFVPSACSLRCLPLPLA